MATVFRVIKRDIVRLLKVPQALVVIGALLILPSLYTWYNVLGFWNPYDNTSELKVCVANLDEGGSSEITGELDVGDMIVEKLEENDQLDWEITSYDDAMEQLDEGQCYAAFVIPQSFTSDLLTITEGSFVQPEITYYVNEKTGPVSPKITDVGATTLEETINATFVSTVTDAITEAVDSALTDTQSDIDSHVSIALQRITDAQSAVTETQSSFDSVSSSAQEAADKVQTAKSALDDAAAQIDEAAGFLDDIQSNCAQVKTSLSAFSASSMPLVSDVLLQAEQATQKTKEAAGKASSSITNAKDDLGGVVDHTASIIEQERGVVEKLNELVAEIPEDEDLPALTEAKTRLQGTVDEISAAVDKAQEVLDSVEQTGSEMDTSLETLSGITASLDEATNNAFDSVDSASNALYSELIPQLQGALDSVTNSAATLQGVLASQNTLIAQTKGALDELSDTLSSASGIVSETSRLFGGVNEELDAIAGDVSTLQSVDIFKDLLGEDGLNAEQISDFMGAPTEVVTESLYPLNAYGSAMAPLFMNLTFWIGAIMLIVIMRQEVDEDGFPDITYTQAYMARFLLFEFLAIIQAIVCCVGVMAIGVQTMNAPALFIAAAVSSMAYMSIMFALSLTLQHIGKGICIVLVFAQIPGATGLYPIEMTSSFFQSVYPFFPFTYGISAMRESICGFYGMNYFHDLAILLLFFVLFLILGLKIRPMIASANYMTAQQVAQSGIFNGEEVSAPRKGYSKAHILEALAHPLDYKISLEKRYETLQNLRPRFIKGAIIAGFAVPVALMVVFALTPAEKVWILTGILIWMILVFVVVIVLESKLYSIQKQLQLDELSRDELITLVGKQKTPDTSSKGGEHHA